MPPVARWADDWPALADAASVFVVYSGAADESGPAWIANAPFRDRARLLHLAERRTANMVHRGTSHFRAAWESICTTAMSWSERDAQQRAERRAEAASRCAELVNAPDILSRFADDLAQGGFAGSTREAKLLYLVVTSRLLDRPL